MHKGNAVTDRTGSLSIKPPGVQSDHLFPTRCLQNTNITKRTHFVSLNYSVTTTIYRRCVRNRKEKRTHFPWERRRPGGESSASTAISGFQTPSEISAKAVNCGARSIAPREFPRKSRSDAPRSAHRRAFCRDLRQGRSR